MFFSELEILRFDLDSGSRILNIKRIPKLKFGVEHENMCLNELRKLWCPQINDNVPPYISGICS